MTNEKLAILWLFSQMKGETTTINESDFDRDGRKCGRIAREFLKDGYVSPLPGTRYKVTSKAWDDITSTIVDNLSDLYERQKHMYYRLYDNKLPFVVLTSSTTNHSFVKPNAIKGHIEEHNEFYLIPNRLLNYGDPTLSSFKGPYKFDELPMAHADADPEVFAVCISCDGLKEYVGDNAFEKEMQKRFPKSLHQFLEDAGIFNKHRAEEFRKAFDTTGEGFFGSQAWDSESNWPAQIDKQVDVALNKIREAEFELRILLEVKAGIAKYGGWDVFVSDYKEKFSELLREHLEKSKNEELGVS